MKSSYKVRAEHFINTIFPYLEGNFYNLYLVKRAVRDYNARYKRNVIVCNGSSRCVLVTSDYVVKWVYNETMAEAIGGNEEELATYKLACEEGYDYLLAECSSVVKNGIQFNIMPRLNMYIHNKPDIFSLLSGDEMCWIADHIEDIHNENYTIVDGAPIIVDYACPPRSNYFFDTDEYNSFSGSM